MSTSNDGVVQPSSDSFWEVGKYMRTVKRCDNGYKLCDQLRALIEQRSDIEKKYASMLTTWSKKWNDFLDKGPEYGTGQAAWRSVLAEAEQVSGLHSQVGERLMGEVYSSVKAWQKENYHKSMMHFKETKEFEDEFRKAQKPWAKRLSKVLEAKREYHTACRTEKSTVNQENNARGDASMSADGLRKLQEKLKKCQKEVEASKDRYQACLKNLNAYNAKYVEDMTEVYDKCQEFELKRINFFKQTFFRLRESLDLSVDPKFGQVYADLQAYISNMDGDKDLKYWSVMRGVDMAMAWPQFEEYSPELQAISKQGKSSVSTTGDGGITITSIRHSRESSYSSYSTDQPPSYTSSTFAASTSSTVPQYSSQVHDNPFGDYDLDTEEGVDLDDSSQGWAVRALYDYARSEEDEIEFKAGDVFVQLSAEDEMGWSRGRKDGVVGLFPGNYVERV
ncbi:protein kinase C and casein kinase substrate in neurons protein 1-like [Babylonia areolata]|uniref:protein kinase C and casein kinase substrate in neurons protein 1-like n=1 Tax=Babylonia areolata TaxID=304850 RepID=UPI003FCFA961